MCQRTGWATSGDATPFRPGSRRARSRPGSGRQGPGCPGRAAAPSDESGRSARRPHGGRRACEPPAPSRPRPRPCSRGAAAARPDRRRTSGVREWVSRRSGSRPRAAATPRRPARHGSPSLTLTPSRGQEQRRGQVVPHRVAGEVGRVERVPAEVAAQPGAPREGRTGSSRDSSTSPARLSIRTPPRSKTPRRPACGKGSIVATGSADLDRSS